MRFYAQELQRGLPVASVLRVPSESSDSDPPGRISSRVHRSYQSCAKQPAAFAARATDTPSDPDPSQRDVPRPPDPEHSNVPRPPDPPYRAADTSEHHELAIPDATARSAPEAVDAVEPPVSLLRDGVNAWIGPPQSARREKSSVARSDIFHTDIRGERFSELFFLGITLQQKRVWALIDSGSSRNIMSEELYRTLIVRPVLQTSEENIVAGNGKPIVLRGVAVFAVRLTTFWLFHEFGVVAELPLPAIIGGELMRKHAARITYQPRGEHLFELGNAVCDTCTRIRNAMVESGDPQLRYCIDTPRRPDAVLRRDVPILVAVPRVHWRDPVSSALCAPEPASSGSVDRKARFQLLCEELKIGALDLPADFKEEVQRVLFELQDAFSASDSDLGRTDLVQHRIHTTGIPFRDKVRQIPWTRRPMVEAEIQRLLQLGIIAPAQQGICPYASAIVLVQKKDKTLRLCVDYRRLNLQTVKDSYNLPRISDLLTQLESARYFASLDLLMGYHQIEVAQEDQQKTAFICHMGLFVYRVMPFGLCNAPATFQRLMNAILSENIGVDCVVYLDDVLIFAETAERLLLSLQNILRKIIAAGLRCKTRKCTLFERKVLYLGFRVAEGIIGPDMSKIEKIVQWPQPRTGTEIASFLGLCNYYRCLVPELAELADVLYKSARDDPLIWSSELQNAFSAIKTPALQRSCSPSSRHFARFYSRNRCVRNRRRSGPKANFRKRVRDPDRVSSWILLQSFKCYRAPLFYIRTRTTSYSQSDSQLSRVPLWPLFHCAN